MKTFLSLFLFAISVNVVFGLLTMLLFPGQISGATTIWDYFHYSVGHLTTSGTTNMTPETTSVKIWTSLYVLTVWTYIFYVTVNHITNIKFGRFG
jgi:hypothetical protein